MKLSPIFLGRIAPFERYIDGASDAFGVRPELIRAVIYIESSGNPNASAKTTTARGLMQITKAAALDMGFSYEELFDPQTNIFCGTKYLASLIKRNGNDERKGVMAYYAGHGTINDNKETQLDRDAETYAQKVFACLV